MKNKRLHKDQFTSHLVQWLLVFDPGDEVVSVLLAFAKEKSIKTAQIAGLGGFREVTLGYFDMPQKKYIPNEVREQVEVMSFIGNLSQSPEGESKLHAHVVVGKRDYTAHGGHLLKAIVNPTLELIITESPVEVTRVMHEDIGLALLKL
jgi:predicted DNA-binding protein with PD1-like motif